jgi:hypothetical protein
VAALAGTGIGHLCSRVLAHCRRDDRNLWLWALDIRIVHHDCVDHRLGAGRDRRLVAVARALFAYLASGHNRAFAMLISGGPFLLVGVLFLLYWARSQSDKASTG